jgi:metallo-beta-lactamase family protein
MPNLKLTRTTEESMAINRVGAVRSSSRAAACCTGRVVHHLKHNLSRPECDVVFTGFRRRARWSRAIVDGRDPCIRRTIQGRGARATLGGFSAHGDQQDLLRWYAGLPGQPHAARAR